MRRRVGLSEFLLLSSDSSCSPLAGILAVGFERYGSEEELAKDAITHLYDVYVKINRDGETDESIHDRAREFFVKMEAGRCTWKGRRR